MDECRSSGVVDSPQQTLCRLRRQPDSEFTMQRGRNMSIKRAAQISAAVALFSVGGLAVPQQTTAAEQDQRVHVNQIQVIGSHNSYHSGFPPSARKYMERNYPKGLHSLDYSHPPLRDQLSAGV